MYAISTCRTLRAKCSSMGPTNLRTIAVIRTALMLVKLTYSDVIVLYVCVSSRSGNTNVLLSVSTCVAERPGCIILSVNLLGASSDTPLCASGMRFMLRIDRLGNRPKK